MLGRLIKQFIAKIYIRVVAFWLALKDKQLPAAAIILTVLMVSYALAPIDLIPDFIPIIGYLDELVIIPALLYLINAITKKSITEKYMGIAIHHIKNQSKPTYTLGTIVVVLSWVLISIIVAFMMK